MDRCKARNKNLATAWNDIKAFDDVPHAWIISALGCAKTWPCCYQLYEGVYEELENNILECKNVLWLKTVKNNHELSAISL